ncbi:MAG: hypothetical protein H6Q60_328 [Oscillospiraceae bacterium]|nr:hypothetical protein [Oscillospiraceae bacterium]
MNQSKEAFYEALLAHINHPGEFSSYNNIRMTRVAEHYAEGELTIRPESLNYLGYVHGGCLAALADTVAGVAVCTSGMGCVTLNYGLNFLRPACGSKIKCVARPEKTGKTICVYQIALTDDQERMVATGEFTFFITKPLELPQR